jgi:hypothetical protein
MLFLANIEDATPLVCVLVAFLGEMEKTRV